MGELATFRNEVEAYLDAHKLKPSRFGRLAANDGSFVFQLRDGREPRSHVREKVRAFMASAPSEGQAA